MLSTVILLGSICLWSCTGPVVNLGALVGLTGGASSAGESVSAALKIAVEDVNAYLAVNGAAFTIEVTEQDTGSDPQTALEAAKDFAAQGINIVIGPQTSEEVAHLLSYVNTNSILLISQATAAFLAIEDDSLFRLVTDDRGQAKEVAETMKGDGLEVIVPVYRYDVYATNLLSLTGEAFEELGGTIGDGVNYDVDATDYTDTVASLSDAVAAAIDTHGAAAVGVYVVAFEEAVELFKAAQDDPVLTLVAWYGSDSLALDAALLADEDAAQFAADRLLLCPMFKSEGDNADEISAEIKAVIGRTPETDALQAYDAVWISALTYLGTGLTADNETLKATLPEVAATYSGVTGSTKLNDAGDRASGSYTFWAIEEQGGSLQWVMQD